MKIINLILFLFISFQINAQDILSLKERARVIEEIQKDRFDNLPSTYGGQELICGLL